MKKTIIIIAFAGMAFAGTISGTLSYPGGMIGAYGVIAINPTDIARFIAGGDSSFDFSSLPMTMLIMPGAYEITESTFTDGMPYNVLGIKLSSIATPRPVSGDAMGLHPDPVYTFVGDAWDIDVTLSKTGTIGGHITYPGNIGDVKINVSDMMTGTAVLESTYTAGAADYAIVVPSGFKTLEFFADVNGNGVWDASELESQASYMNISITGWGPIVFAGGGDRFATGVDIDMPASGVDEKEARSAKLDLTCVPNPFLSRASLKYASDGDGTIKIADLSGRIVKEYDVQGSGEIEFGSGIAVGSYFIILNCAGKEVVKKVLIIR